MRANTESMWYALGGVPVEGGAGEEWWADEEWCPRGPVALRHGELADRDLGRA